MTDYEYKLFMLPKQVDDGGATVTAGGEFAPSLQRQINLIVGNGWEFVGREEMPVERRRWIILKRREMDDYLVFRRPVAQTQRQHPPTRPDMPTVRPRRVTVAGLAARGRVVRLRHGAASPAR